MNFYFSIICVVPIYSIHLIRSVQSDLTVYSYSPLNIFIEPFRRLMGTKIGLNARPLSLWHILSIGIPYFVLRYSLQYTVYNIFIKILSEFRTKQEQHVRLNEVAQIENINDIELFIQGTRTIVDNLETELEGFTGFYKGLGFLILKYGFIYLLSYSIKLFIEKLATLYAQQTSEIGKFHYATKQLQ
ncbi:unnamed protein product [Didymodactylos carnosus]|uniref:Uncharacterized protein n=1 Tax=Didymodactylos carnosus TaxID=1234261 RepID=A0A8S2JDE6_9BILA|nr:unnamed protein product [Didymodactylos carnosus]CAF3806036.1 unnamed protein product [Didymodactylos carnosus]